MSNTEIIVTFAAAIVVALVATAVIAAIIFARRMMRTANGREMHCHSTVIRSGETGEEGKDPIEGLHAMFGPGHVDQTLRQAIQVCWMATPKERRNVEEVEKQVREMMERALASFREDGERFGERK